jgi:NADPH:quinone reductase-like Zn-dependent oxidoreductase
MMAATSAAASPGAGPGTSRPGGPRRMRAAVLHGHGQPPEYGWHLVPKRGAGQVTVRVTAAPINPLDLLCATGNSYFGAPALPYVPGAQGVGVIEEVGTLADAPHGALAAGQRVWFSGSAGMAPGDGSMAELCVVGQDAVLPLRDGVSDDLAAVLGLSAIAAWMALSWRGGLRPGEHVLVLGASGTVGQVGIQAARLLGAGRVAAACRDPHGRQRAAELGADAVADLSGEEAGVLARRLAEACAGRLDLVLDPVWGLPARAALEVLSPGGRLVNLGSSAAPQASFSSATLRSGMREVLGYTNNALSSRQKADALAAILAHAAAGDLDTDREVLPLAEVAAGWARCGRAPHRKAVMIPP